MKRAQCRACTAFFIRGRRLLQEILARTNRRYGIDERIYPSDLPEKRFHRVRGGHLSRSQQPAKRTGVSVM